MFIFFTKGIKHPFKYKATAQYGVSVVHIVNITELHLPFKDAIILMTGLMYSVEALGARARTGLFRLSKSCKWSAWSFSKTASYPIVTSREHGVSTNDTL